jgi:hypothetical protein
MLNKKIFIPATFLMVVLFLSGCANRATVTMDQSFNLDSIKSLHIRNSGGGGDELIPIIENKLKEMNYKVTSGDEVSPDADAIITYRDKWMWDITMYMIELTVTVRDTQDDFPLATANSMHASLTRKSPEEMVDEALNNIFKHGEEDDS